MACGNAAYKAGRLEEAYFAWKEAVDIDPARTEALGANLRKLRARLVAGALEAARRADRDGRREEAEAGYRKVLALSPDATADRAEAVSWLDQTEQRSRWSRRLRVLAGAFGVTAASALVAWFVYRALQ